VRIRTVAGLTTNKLRVAFEQARASPGTPRDLESGIKLAACDREALCLRICSALLSPETS
jgi:hypothetical protein